MSQCPIPSHQDQASLSPPPFQPPNHLYSLNSNTNNSFEPPSPLYPSTTTNAKVPEVVINSKFKFNSNNPQRLPTLLFQQNKKANSCNIRDQPLQPGDMAKSDVFMMPYAPKNQSVIRAGYQPLKSAASKLPPRGKQDLTTAATTTIARMSLDRISGRKLDESSQGPIIHISDSFNSPQNITNRRKEITYSPMQNSHANQNHSLNLQISPNIEQRSEFLALQKKIAASVCASSDFEKNIQPNSNNSAAAIQSNFSQQERSISALSRSLQFQPKQPALLNNIRSKRVISQQSNRKQQDIKASPLEDFNTGATRRSKSVMRNKQPKQQEKTKRFNRNALTALDSHQTSKVTPVSNKHTLNMSQNIQTRGKNRPNSLQNTTTTKKKTSSENQRYLYKQTQQQQHYPSFGTIPQSMTNKNMLNDMIMTPSNDLISRKDLLNKTPTLVKKEKILKNKTAQIVASFGVTRTTSSNKRDGKIDKLIRANLKHKKELQQIEKVKALEQVKAQLDLKEKLYRTNQEVRLNNLKKQFNSKTPQRPQSNFKNVPSTKVNKKTPGVNSSRTGILQKRIQDGDVQKFKDFQYQEPECQRTRSLVQTLNQEMKEIRDQVFGKTSQKKKQSESGEILSKTPHLIPKFMENQKKPKQKRYIQSTSPFQESQLQTQQRKKPPTKSKQVKFPMILQKLNEQRSSSSPPNDSFFINESAISPISQPIDFSKNIQNEMGHNLRIETVSKQNDTTLSSQYFSKQRQQQHSQRKQAIYIQKQEQQERNIKRGKQDQGKLIFHNDVLNRSNLLRKSSHKKTSDLELENKANNLKNKLLKLDQEALKIAKRSFSKKQKQEQEDKRRNRILHSDTMNSSFCGGPTYDNEEQVVDQKKSKKVKKNASKKMMQTIQIDQSDDKVQLQQHTMLIGGGDLTAKALKLKKKQIKISSNSQQASKRINNKASLEDGKSYSQPKLQKNFLKVNNDKRQGKLNLSGLPKVPAKTPDSHYGSNFIRTPSIQKRSPTSLSPPCIGKRVSKRNKDPRRQQSSSTIDKDQLEEQEQKNVKPNLNQKKRKNNLATSAPKSPFGASSKRPPFFKPPPSKKQSKANEAGKKKQQLELEEEKKQHVKTKPKSSTNKDATKSEVNKKAHLLNELIKIRDQLSDPNILNEMKDYQELLEQLIPKKMEQDRKNTESLQNQRKLRQKQSKTTNNKKPKKTTKQPTKLQKLPTVKESYSSNISSQISSNPKPVQKLPNKQIPKQSSEQLQESSEILVIKTNAQTLTPPAPYKNVQKPNKLSSAKQQNLLDDQQNSILDSLNLVPHPTDNMQQHKPQISIQSSSNNLIRQSAAILIQRNVRHFLQNRKTVEQAYAPPKFKSNMFRQHHPNYLYPQGSPIDESNNISSIQPNKDMDSIDENFFDANNNKFAGDDDENNLQDEQQAVEVAQDEQQKFEIPPQAIQKAIQYLSQQEIEIGRSLEQQQYITLLRDAGADDELILQVLRIAQEEQEDDQQDNQQQQFEQHNKNNEQNLITDQDDNQIFYNQGQGQLVIDQNKLNMQTQNESDFLNLNDDNNNAYQDQDDSQNFQLLLGSGGGVGGQHQHLSRWKSVPQILILPSLVKSDLNQEQQQAEMMVMQNYQIGDNNQHAQYQVDDDDEDDQQQSDIIFHQQQQQKHQQPIINTHKKQQLIIDSNIDSGRIFPPTASPGVMIVNEAVDDHNLEDQLGQAIDGVNIDSIIENGDDNFEEQDNLNSGKNYQMIPSGVSTLNRLQEIMGVGGGVISNSDSRELVGSSVQQSIQKEDDEGAKEFTLGYGEDGEEQSSSNVVHISTIIDQESLYRQQNSLDNKQMLNIQGDDGNYDRNDQSDMLLDNSHIDKSIEDLVAPSNEGTDVANIVPAINEALKEQKRGRQQNLEKIPTFQQFKQQQFNNNKIDLRGHQRYDSEISASASNYINIIGDPQERHHQPKQQSDQQQQEEGDPRAIISTISYDNNQELNQQDYDDEDQDEEQQNIYPDDQERQYFEDPEHELDQFDQLGLELPSIQETDLYALRQQHENARMTKSQLESEQNYDYSNDKKHIQITPKPKLQIQITSPQNSAVGYNSSAAKNRAINAALPPPVPRPRQVVPTLDLRKLSRTQQISQLQKQGSEESNPQFEILREVHPDTSAPNTMGRSMFDRNFFQEFTQSQRGNAISQVGIYFI